jgi:hypothetical protein
VEVVHQHQHIQPPQQVLDKLTLVVVEVVVRIALMEAVQMVDQG